MQKWCYQNETQISNPELTISLLAIYYTNQVKELMAENGSKCYANLR